jgi:hypothetical protein
VSPESDTASFWVPFAGGTLIVVLKSFEELKRLVPTK